MVTDGHELMVDRVIRFFRSVCVEDWFRRRAGRCGIDRSQVDFPGIDCTVIDVVAGENVNLVADAHGMARHFAI